MRFQLASALLLLLLLRVAAAALDLNEPPPADQEEPPGWLAALRGKVGALTSKLPDYFDFGAFQRRFGRQYASTAESVYRRAVFLGNCMQLFKWRVLRRAGHPGAQYEVGVNKFTDRSQEEFKRIYMSGPPFEARPEGQAPADYYAAVEREAQRRASWTPELASQTAARDRDDSLDELVHDELQARRQIEAMLQQRLVPPEALDLDPRQLREAIHEELEGADESSQSAASVQHDQQPLPPPGTWRHLPEIALGLARTPSELVRAGQSLDWSRHRCFHQIYDQGDKCGKCYVMAATALAEFYKCSESAAEPDWTPRKFSKDYVLDCAPRYTPTAMGCAGGSLLETLRFISAAGVYNIRGWRERRRQALAELPAGAAREARCPLDPLVTPLEHWGDIRVGVQPEPVPVGSWLLALRDGPLAVSVQMPAQGVDSYKGGVHDGAGCTNSGNWHAMLLVGFGRDSWEEPGYWRFRNSWGADWGEAGHFRLSMAVPGECLAGGVRLYRT